MHAQGLVTLVVVALNRRFLQRAVHAFYLTIRPGMTYPRQAMLDPVLAAHPIKQVHERVSVPATMGELDAVIGQHRVQPVGIEGNDGFEEAYRCRSLGLLMQLGIGNLRRAIDGNEEIELALSSSDLRDVDMDVSDGIFLELTLRTGFAAQVRQAADTVALQAAVKRGAPQMGDRGLQGIEAVIKRQQRVAAKGHNGSLLLRREHGRVRVLGSHRCVFDRSAVAPLGNGFSIDVMLASQGAHRGLALLNGASDDLRSSGAAV